MEINELMPTIEAILFASGEAVSISRLSEATETNRTAVLSACELLSEKLTARDSGLRLVFLEGKCQMTTRQKYGDSIRKALDLRRKAPLSPASLEVLALIAYNQPVTKAFLEQVRGVDCSGVVTSLCEKKLVEEKGRLELPGRPLVFGTTSDFLRVFGLSHLGELPPLPENDEEQIEGQAVLKEFSETATLEEEEEAELLPLDNPED